jgi:hypothetical protein
MVEAIRCDTLAPGGERSCFGRVDAKHRYAHCPTASLNGLCGVFWVNIMGQISKFLGKSEKVFEASTFFKYYIYISILPVSLGC